MQLVHNGEGLYCLHTPYSEQAKRTLFNLLTQEETSPFKSEIQRKKKLQAAMHQAAVHQDLLKRTDQNVRPQQACRGKKMYVDLYIKIVICSSILLSTLFYIAKIALNIYIWWTGLVKYIQSINQSSSLFILSLSLYL